MHKFKVTTYNKFGDFKKDYFFDDIKKAIDRYSEVAKSVNYKMPMLPTIWIYENESDKFIRVHDFGFKEATEENIRKWIKERIIDTDYLLENIENE